MFRWFSASKVDIVFGSHVGANLVSFWHPKSTKIHSNTDLNTYGQTTQMEFVEVSHRKMFLSVKDNYIHSHHQSI